MSLSSEVEALAARIRSEFNEHKSRGLHAASTTEVPIYYAGGQGDSFVFTVEAGLAFEYGMPVIAYQPASNPSFNASFFAGSVLDYTGTSLTVSIDYNQYEWATGETGNDWKIFPGLYTPPAAGSLPPTPGPGTFGMHFLTWFRATDTMEWTDPESSPGYFVPVDPSEGSVLSASSSNLPVWVSRDSLVADASDTVKGKVELATTAEATTGTSSTLAVTPAGLKTVADTKAASTHSHAISDTTGLQTALDGKAASSHTHSISNTTGLQTALDAKVEGTGITSIVKITQSSYDALGTKDSATLYVIVG